MSKKLPAALTSYDLLKALAIVLMFADHIGHHFYPDEMWFRVFGRMCLPIWFFLVGYANTTKLDRWIWVGAVVVFASAVVSGQLVFPVNILFTILLIRAVRNEVAVRALHSPESLRGMFLILFFLGFPTSVLFEYGTAAMMLALIGFMVRHRDVLLETVSYKYMVMYASVSLFSFYMVQSMMMPTLTGVQAIVLFAGYGAVGYVLWVFKPIVFEGDKKIMSNSFARVFQFLGRNTLLIYVVHLVIFRLICMALFPEDYAFMAWQFFPEGVTLKHM